MFNGQMSLDEKEEAVRSFKAQDQILISTEAGGEGRNFQFCHLMVNYDLPWNPMRIEQRIGRLDRIGQKLPVRIYNLFCEETVEERVLEVLERRIGLFQESVGSLDPILGEVERDIERLVLSDAAAFDAEFRHYETALERRVREAREKERTLADFVLDRASLRHDLAIELLQQSPLARWLDLERFATRCLPYFGGTLKDHYEGGQVVSLSPRLMTRMQQRHSTIRGTFDPEIAREREDLPFFAFGHWLADGLAGLPLLVDPVTTAVRQASDVPPGEWVEVYYEIRGEGVRPTGWFIRHLVGPDLAVRSEQIKAMPAIGEPVPRLRGSQLGRVRPGSEPAVNSRPTMRPLARESGRTTTSHGPRRSTGPSGSSATGASGSQRSSRSRRPGSGKKKHPDRIETAGCSLPGAGRSPRTASG